MQNHALPDLARVDISSALLDLRRGAAAAVTWCSEHPPEPGSPAATLISEEPPELAGQAVKTLQVIGLAISTGVQQMEGFTVLLRSNRGLGSPLASTARSGIEAWGRAWYLMGEGTGAEFVRRRLVMRLAEVDWAVRVGASFNSYDEDGGFIPVAAADTRAAEVAVLARLGMSERPKAPSYTRLAIDLMEAAELDDPPGQYSHLSSVAHGEWSALLALSFEVGPVPGDTSSTMYRLGMPARNALQYSYLLTRCLNAVIRRRLTLWGNPPSAVERWEQIATRASAKLQAIDDAVTAPRA